MSTHFEALKGLPRQLTERLIHQTLERRLSHVEKRSAAEQTKLVDDRVYDSSLDDVGETARSLCSFEAHPAYQQLHILVGVSKRLGVASPYFKVHEGIADSTTRIAGKDYVNYSNYNYLGLSGDPEVTGAAKAALDRFGSSVSASRVVSGERPLHGELERGLAEVYEVEDCLTFVSGHATNVTTIGYLFGPKDLILHDALVHNSVVQGIQLSGAKRLPFPHNDYASLEETLAQQRRFYERVLIVLEGIYSMDGDYPDLPKFVEIKKRYRCFLMLDEAHALGVMGRTGLGIREHFGLSGTAVDIWMGTLSKTLAACGGYIAGSRPLVELLRHWAPGFLYSVGMSPPMAGAALAALQKMRREPARVSTLQARGQMFLELARAAGVDTGLATGFSVIPAITGSSLKALRVSNALFDQGINVQPIVYPAVPEKSARLRFFISSTHTEAQIQSTIPILAEAIRSA
jgi:8-amino-7-oxononanoate synthase